MSADSFFYKPEHELPLELDDRFRTLSIPLGLQKRALELRRSIYGRHTIETTYRVMTDIFEMLSYLCDSEYKAEDIEIVMGPLWHGALCLWAAAEKYMDQNPLYARRTATQRAQMNAAIREAITGNLPGTKAEQPHLLVKPI